jgi:hypothetical protein
MKNQPDINKLLASFHRKRLHKIKRSQQLNEKLFDLIKNLKDKDIFVPITYTSNIYQNERSQIDENLQQLSQKNPTFSLWYTIEITTQKKYFIYKYEEGGNKHLIYGFEIPSVPKHLAEDDYFSARIYIDRYLYEKNNSKELMNFLMRLFNCFHISDLNSNYNVSEHDKGKEKISEIDLDSRMEPK